MPKLIAIIDDDSEDIEFLRSAILAVDPAARCMAFTSAQEAIAHISTNRIPPDVIFVDYNMPAFNGVECLQIFNAFRALNYTSYVAISSNMSPALERTFFDHGASSVFEKPASVEGYQKVIEHVFSNTFGEVRSS